MTLADVVAGFYPAKAPSAKSRPSYVAMFNALVDAGRREVISDFPRFFAAAPPTDGPKPEPVRRGATLLEPTAPAEQSRVEPFPDEFVSAFIERALWIQANLADGLIESVRRDRRVQAELQDRGYSMRGDIAGPARREALAAGPWLDACGRPLTQLKYPIIQNLERHQPALSTQWPPQDMRALLRMMTVLPGELFRDAGDLRGRKRACRDAGEGVAGPRARRSAERT